jgi:hypothetical protein
MLQEWVICDPKCNVGVSPLRRAKVPRGFGRDDELVAKMTFKSVNLCGMMGDLIV